MPEPTQDAVRPIDQTVFDLREIRDAAAILLRQDPLTLTRHHLQEFMRLVDSRLDALRGDWE